MSTPANDLNINTPGICVFNGVDTFLGRTLTAGSGITITNGTGIAGNPVISSSSGGVDLHTARYIVSANGSSDGANYTTIGAAYAAANAAGGKQTVFIQPGTYTENLTLIAGINLSAFDSDGVVSGQGISTPVVPSVIILGTVTASFTGNVTLAGIQLKTNGSAALVTSGSTTGQLMLNSCSIFANNATGFTLNSANLGVTFYNCSFNSTSTNLLFAITTGGVDFEFCVISLSNTASASTIAAVNVEFNACDIAGLSVTTSTTGSVVAIATRWQYSGNILLTTVGTGNSFIFNCDLESGSASTISIGTGTSVSITNSSISSSNTNAITGAGTLKSGNNVFTNTSSTVNPSTNTILPVSEIYSPNGITFDNSNVLSNYAIGTFTPTLVGQSSAGTTTYSQQNGYYTRIGNMVFLQGFITISAASGTGNILLGGFPFTIKNQTAGFTNGSIFFAGSASWPLPAGGTSLSVLGNSNTTGANIYASGSAVAGGNVQMANAALTITYNLAYQI